MTPRTLERRIEDATGLGTLAHIVAHVIRADREDLAYLSEAELIERCEYHGEAIWDSILGPAIDRVTDALMDDMEPDPT